MNAIVNFARVFPHPIYRGGHPTRDGWDYLKANGIKTVIKLDFPDEGIDDDRFKIVDCRMSPKDFWEMFGAPNQGDVARAVDAMSDQTNWPLFVHCLHGQDRTGLVVGEFRVLHDGWACDSAYAEMMQHGFHPELLDLVRTWEAFGSAHQ